MHGQNASRSPETKGVDCAERSPSEDREKGMPRTINEAGEIPRTAKARDFSLGNKADALRFHHAHHP